MRIIYAPMNKPYYEQWGLTMALMKHSDCRIFDFMRAHHYHKQDGMMKRLDALFAKFKPDVFFGQFHRNNMISNRNFALLKRKYPGTLFAQWYGDLRESVDSAMQERMSIFDMLLLSNESESQREVYKRGGAKRIEYMQTAVVPYQPDWDAQRKNKVCFCASYTSGNSHELSQDRRDIVFQLAKDMPEQFELYGTGWGRFQELDHCYKGKCRYHDQMDLYAKYDVVLSYDHYKRHRHYWSTRLMFSLMSGACTVSLNTKNIEDFFIDGHDMLLFNNNEEAVEKIYKALSNPVVSKQIGMHGHETCIKKHTWDCRAKEILKIFKSKET